MVAATFVAFILIGLDTTYGHHITEAFPMFRMSPSAARSVLSAIVGAMVTSTGVVFSITIVALSLASSQYGSRLIRTYRGRRTTHFTLGIFVSTSLYCILVLASIREIGEFSFVPTVSVTVGILLTIVCLATLVYYIHDMSRAIQAPVVIQSSADDLDAAVSRLFPERFGAEAKEDAAHQELDDSACKAIEEAFTEPLLSVKCDCVGYLQAVENETLMGLAEEKDIVIRLQLQPGDFLHMRTILADVFSEKENTLDEGDRKSIADRIQGSLIVGSERTHMQDIRYAFNELVDIAVRALSPGINDPFTAVNCVDRLHAALVALSEREPPRRYRLNDNGQLRVIADPISFEECVKGSLIVIQNYATGSPMVMSRIESALLSLEE